MYRGGSIYCCEGCKSCQKGIRNAHSVGSTDNYYNNAGNYGSTSPVTVERRSLDNFNTPKIRREGSSIGIPRDDPRERYIDDTRREGGNVPSVEQLLQQPRTPSGSSVMPTVPPATRPRVPTPNLDYSPIDTIPFSPSDEVVFPPDPFPTDVEVDVDMGVPITLEELRRLDPSVQKFEILSIEDAGMESPVR